MVQDGRGQWFEEGYDDGGWGSAKVLGKNGDQPWGVVEGITGQASWISLEESGKPDVMFCRGVLSAEPGQWKEILSTVTVVSVNSNCSNLLTVY